MDYTQILQIAKLFMLIFIPILTLIAAYKIDWSIVTKSANERLRSQVLGALDDASQKNPTGYFNLNRIDNFLRSHGAYYMFTTLDPFTFLMIKVGVGILFFLVAFTLVESSILIATVSGFILAVLGFFSFDWLLDFANKSDNDNMLSDIKSIFDTLRTQTKAGVFLTNSLTECYMIVSNSRLKAALLDMTNKIIIKNDIEDAVNDFNKEFDNPYIDTLCITILQSMESGKSVQILEDLSKQIADMQSAINIKEQEKLDAKIQVLEILIFVGLLGAVIYALVISLFGVYKGF